MKIVHLCLASFFPDGYSYQENMLPKFHKQMGLDVEVIASRVTFDANGKVTLYPEAKYYRNEYDIPVTRLEYKAPFKLYRLLRRYVGFRAALEKAAPDVIFIHGGQFMDIDVVAAYAKKHPDVRIYVDNHADFSNSAKNWLSRAVLHKIIWKRCEHVIEPYTKKFYGVLPVRVDFLKGVYKLPPEKCELLVMGADHDEVERTKRCNSGAVIRQKHGITEQDVLIMTGGKLNQYRPETLNLLEAVSELGNPHMKVLFFGVVDPMYRERFEQMVEEGIVINAGWLTVPQTYDYMAASDLLVFPGLHSVLWEQAVGMGKPCIFRKLEGTDHVDVNGNCKLIDDVSRDGIKRALQTVLEPACLKQMQMRAQEVAHLFSYREIAKRAIEEQ